MLIAAGTLAYQIFLHARAAWNQQVYPAYVNYQTVIEVNDKAGDRVERYDSALDTKTGRVWIDPVSDYEMVHHASTRGVGFNLNRAPHADPSTDFIGLPLLAPNYSFTIGEPYAIAALTDAQIVKLVRDQFHDPNPHPVATATPDVSGGLRVITTVSAIRRPDYDVTLVGKEAVGGTQCYHLTLRPFIVTGKYRLRDLWVNETTYATVRARTALNFIDGPGTQIPWLIDFADVGGARYITSEVAEGKYHYSSKAYDRVAIRFENVHPRTAPWPMQIVAPSAYLLLFEPTD